MQNNIFLGLFVGHNIVTLKKVDSTNTYLKQALSKSKPFAEGTVIMAEEQYQGRGQTSNTWISQAGKNLTFSILLNPSFLDVSKQFVLNRAVSLALNDVLRKYFGDEAKIKWPNDSYVGNQKIGGMLIENIIQGIQLKHAIIGIGLNVNQIEFPSELKHISSFKKILHADYDLQSILIEICAAIEARYLQLKSGKFDLLDTEYFEKLYQANEWKSYKIDGIIQPGKIYGISAEGYLQVETKAGSRSFGIKEIEFIKS
ncbi:biotin--[acetyl-CoA-carboxylase] ligase [Daejeonella oryzae]|uniref:biotin--[acetyl-CoA-carboxylase] ligase n=1 Tax=Daejeonella oryzae TaxID=1122943 RepID=UPI0004101398|nr:biotin--[acetyl-CoA-carboxylase] ligase [Daejeonella oryzae]